MTTLVGQPAVRRTIVGYCRPWTVRPGEEVKFMVSCENGECYQADLVRIICADNLSSTDRFKEQELQAPFTGSHASRLQSTHLGSYVEIAPKAVLNWLTTFTVQAMVCPTLLPRGERVRAGAITFTSEKPVFDDQYIVSRWDDRTQRGWALLIDGAGRLVFMVGVDDGVHRVVLERVLVQDKWFLVCGGVDAERGVIHVTAKGVGCAPGDLVGWPEMQREAIYSSGEKVPQAGPLCFAAGAGGTGKESIFRPAHCFNGKLDRVRLTEGVITINEALELAGTVIPENWRARVIAFWDFSRSIDQVEVVDVSPNALHGITINVPTRAVRGVDWDGSVNDWRERPEHYSAIHFHDDDLYDAQWEADFSYTIPRDLPSGIYAARLRHGASEDYIPFFVAPPRQQVRASVALLLPTLTYTAYTNVTALTTFKSRRKVRGDSGELKVIEADWHPCVLQNAGDAAFLLENYRRFGQSIYSNHSDGTLRSCASQLHPNMTIKPKVVNWTLVADTYLTDWLEQKKVPYDVITDDLLHEEGVELLKRYAVVLTGNHPEYYTQRMLDAVDQYQRLGGRWMYLGGNGFYWLTSVHSQLPGVIEVRKDPRDYSGYCPRSQLRHAFDGREGGLWRDIGRTPQMLVGVGFEDITCFEHAAPYKRLPHSYEGRATFIFKGVSSETFGDYGLFGNGAAGQEVDEINYERGTPMHALHLARAEFPDRVNANDPLAELNSFNAKKPTADLVFFETPHGGAVFSVGSMSWVGALSHNGYDNDISRITENVLRRFMDKTPFPLDDLAGTATQSPLFEVK